MKQDDFIEDLKALCEQYNFQELIKDNKMAVMGIAWEAIEYLLSHFSTDIATVFSYDIVRHIAARLKDDINTTHKSHLFAIELEKSHEKQLKEVIDYINELKNKRDESKSKRLKA